MHHLDTRRGHQQFHREVSHVANAAGTERQRLGFGFGECDQPFDVIHRNTRMHHQHRWPEGNQAQRDEILADIEGQLDRQAGNGNGRVRHQHGVAVGIGGAVVDDERSAEGVGEFLADRARGEIGAPARAEADDDTHGFRRKFACAVLGCGDRRNGAAGNGGGDAGAKLATGHQNSPRIVIGGAPGPAGQAATA